MLVACAVQADAAVDGDVTVVFCTLLDDGQRGCPGCGADGVYRDTVIRTVTDVPVVGHPLRLRVRVPRYRCVSIDCQREVFAHNTDRLARRGWSTTRRCARYICRRLMIDRATVAAVARELGLSWDTVNTIAMDATRTIIASDTTRLDGVRVIGVDEHRWSHTRRHGEDGYVTVIIDLTPVLDGTGRARLLDLAPGRSAAAFKTWLAQHSSAFRDQVLFLKHNLNAQAIRSLDTTSRTLQADIGRLIEDMEKSIREADAFIKTLQPAS